MEDLIKALQIFFKYENNYNPTHCEHDTLFVKADPELISNEDKVELEKLGFIEDEDEGDGFYSFRFGSC